MARIDVSAELPQGAKTEDVLKAIKGRLWGENEQRAQILEFDLEHGITDVEILDSTPEYAIATVENKRERTRHVWVIGVSDDREDRLFIHPVRGRRLPFSSEEGAERLIPGGPLAPGTLVTLALREIERRDQGFSRRIQGDIMMALGVLRRAPAWTGRVDLVVGERHDVLDEPDHFLRLDDSGVSLTRPTTEEPHLQNAPLGLRFAHHRVTCPAGVITATWGMGSGIPVALCFGRFDIAHEEHGGVTIEVPEGFVAVLAPQDDGVRHTIAELVEGGEGTPPVMFD